MEKTERQAEAHYSGIGEDISVRMPLDLISKRDQVALMHALMRKTGLTDALYKDATPEFQAQVNEAWNKATATYVGEKV